MIDNQDIKQQQRNEIKKFQLDFEEKHGIDNDTFYDLFEEYIAEIYKNYEKL